MLVIKLYIWIVIIDTILFMLIANNIIRINTSPISAIFSITQQLTQPVLQPIRRVLPSLADGLDLSPVVLILALVLAKYLLINNTPCFSLL